MPARYTVSLYERPRSPFWYARVFFEGEGGADHRFSTGIAVGSRKRETARDAQRVAEQRAVTLAAAVEGEQVAATDTALEAVAERMLKQKLADRRRQRAIDALAFNLDKHVTPYFGATRDVGSIRRPDLEAFKRHLSTVLNGPTSINNALTAIRQVLKHACFVEELLESMPMVKNVAVSQEGMGRALTPDEFEALIDSVDDRAQEAREYLLFLGNTGLRKTEALAIRWVWIDWAGRVIRIPAEYRKGGKPQLAPTPVNDVVLALLRRRQKRKEQPSLGRVWFQQKHDGARNSAAERAGLGRIRNHDLRHTLGSLAHASGAAATEVRDLLGHSTMAMVSRYGHSYGDKLQEVAQRVQLGASSVPGSVPGKRSKKAGNTQKRDQRSGGAKKGYR